MGKRTETRKGRLSQFLATVALVVAPALCAAQHDFQRTWMAGGAFGIDMSADRDARVFASVGSGQGVSSGVKIGDPDGFWLVKSFLSPVRDYFEPHMMPDGQSFVANYYQADRGLVVQRRRISDGVVLWEIDGLDGDGQLSLSGDGRVGIVACQQNARVIDLVQGRVLYTIGEGWYLTVRMSPDGSFFLWSHRDSPDVHVVDTASGIETRMIVKNAFPYQRKMAYMSVDALDISPDGSKVAVAIRSDAGPVNGFLSVIDIALNRPVFVKPVTGSQLRLKYSPDGDRLLAFARQSPLEPRRPFVLSSSSGQVLSNFDAGWGWVTSVVWSPKGDKVWLSGGVSNNGPFDRVASYDPATGNKLFEGREHGFVGWPHGVIIRDGLVYSANQRIACRRLSDGKNLWWTTVPGAFLQGVALSPDGRVAVSISYDVLFYFDTSDGHFIRKVQLSQDLHVRQYGTIEHQVPSSPYMCIIGDDRIWIVDFQGNEVSAASPHNGYHFSGVTLPGGATCLVARSSTEGMVVDELRTSDLSTVRTVPGNGGNLALSDDGTLVALLPYKQTALDVVRLEVRRVSDWALVMSEQTSGNQEYSSAAFSPDNAYLWVGFRQDYVGELRRYRIADGLVDTHVGTETAQLLAAIDVDTDGRTAAYLRDDGNIVVGTLTGN